MIDSIWLTEFKKNNLIIVKFDFKKSLVQFECNLKMLRSEDFKIQKIVTSNEKEICVTRFIRTNHEEVFISYKTFYPLFNTCSCITTCITPKFQITSRVFES